MRRFLCPVCRAAVTSELHGSQRTRFYYMICPSCGAMVCLDGKRVL